MSAYETNTKALAIRTALAESDPPSKSRTPVDYVLAVLIDHSSSMDTKDKIEGVISGQAAMFAAFNGSSLDEIDLMIAQIGFASEQFALHPIVKWGSEKIVRLTVANYRPNGQTALFDCLRDTTWLLNEYAKAGARKPINKSYKLSIAVLSDGRHNHGECSLEEAREALADFQCRTGKVIFAAIGDSREEVERARQQATALGVSSDLIIVDSDPKQIRAAFELFSSQTLREMQDSLSVYVVDE